MPCPSHPPWLDHSNYTSYEAPHCAVFSNLLLLHPSSVRVFTSATFRRSSPSSRTSLLMLSCVICVGWVATCLGPFFFIWLVLGAWGWDPIGLTRRCIVNCAGHLENCNIVF
jgi:hypothetical protein